MKNGKKWTTFVAGMVTMALICALGVTALGASTTDLHDVMVGGITIVMDGQELHPTDANGKAVDAMIYNGTTYLPVRAVATAVGKAVYWDGPNYTVYLGDMDGTLEHPTVMLKDMTNIGRRAIEKTDKLIDNYGNTYSSAICNGIYMNNPMAHEFLLNMKYSHFKGTLYIPEGQSSDSPVTLSVTADGVNLYTSPPMTKTSQPVQIDVNVTGYNDIIIEFSSGSASGLLCLADAGFYQ